MFTASATRLYTVTVSADIFLKKTQKNYTLRPQTQEDYTSGTATAVYHIQDLKTKLMQM